MIHRICVVHEGSCLYAWLMHKDIYGYVKGRINSRIMKGNGTKRKNVNPINKILGFVFFFFFPEDATLEPLRGALNS